MKTAYDALKALEAAGIKIHGTPTIECNGEAAGEILHVTISGTTEAFGRFGKVAYLVGDDDPEGGMKVIFAHSEAEVKEIWFVETKFQPSDVRRAQEYDCYLAQGGPSEQVLFEEHGWWMPCGACDEQVTLADGKWHDGDAWHHCCLEAAAETSRTRENGVGLWRVNLPEAEYMIAAYSLEQAQAVQVANALVGDQVALTECEDLDAEETLGPEDGYRVITYRQMIQETAAKYGDQAFPRLLVAAEV